MASAWYIHVEEVSLYNEFWERKEKVIFIFFLIVVFFGEEREEIKRRIRKAWHWFNLL